MERSPAKRPPSGPARRGTPARQETEFIGQSTDNFGGKNWEDLFTSRTLARLLTAFLTHPDATFYQRELVDRASARFFTVQRELARLAKAGLVVRTRRGNRVYYQANRRHPAFEAPKAGHREGYGAGRRASPGLGSPGRSGASGACVRFLGTRGRGGRQRPRPAAHRRPEAPGGRYSAGAGRSATRKGVQQNTDCEHFRRVRVVFDTVAWDCGVDLTPEFVYAKCDVTKEPFDRDR